MVKTAVFSGGPLDGHTQPVESLFLGFETNLFPHITYNIQGEKVHYGPDREAEAEDGQIIYRQCWFTEAKPKE